MVTCGTFDVITILNIMPKAKTGEKKITGEGRFKMTIWVDTPVYFNLEKCKAAYAQKKGKPVRLSRFIEAAIFDPYLKAAKEAGILK